MATRVREIYAAVWPDRPPARFTAQLSLHLERSGFAMTVATVDGDIVGFAYGYTGERGQYWSDIVATATGADAAAHWVGGHFEFAELALLPHARGSGAGRELATALLDSRTEQRALLQAAVGNAPALALYASLGFREIGRIGPQLFLGRDTARETGAL